MIIVRYTIVKNGISVALLPTPAMLFHSTDLPHTRVAAGILILGGAR